MSIAIDSNRKSNPSHRICHLRAVPPGHVADLVYGIIIWVNAKVPALRKVYGQIEVIQNRILRTITFTQLKDHVLVITLSKKLEILKIQDIYIQKVYKLIHLFHDNKLPIAYKAYFRPIWYEIGE